MSQILVILNPSAHSTKAGDKSGRIHDFSGADVALTTGAGDATRFALEAAGKGYKIVVAAGGDGTINEVANGLVGTGVTLGVLPVGTMNVFAAELGLPTDLDEAWKVIQAGRTKEIDLAKANEQYFVQLAGVGLDAQVVKETSWVMKRNLGPLSYLISAAQIAARKPPRLIVKANGETMEGCFVLIGNGRFYGGPLAFFKRARVDDGRLDALVFQKMGYLDLAWYMGNIIMGRHTKLHDVTYFQAREIEVTSDEAVPVEVDGELATELPVTFRVSSRKLRVLVP